MIITIPPSFVEERTYILEVLLGEFLGIPFEIKTSTDVEDYHLTFEDKVLVIQSAFWKEEEYLSREYIPGKVSWMISPYDETDKFPVIYGHGKIEGNICYVDVFASAFFMLTRWEEFVIDAKDKHNRFPVEASLAYQQDFLHLPVVNMYVELLWSFFQANGYQGERKKWTTTLVNTCDVDVPFVWRKPRNLLGRLKYHLTHSKKPLAWFTHELPSYLLTTLGLKKDPSATYDYLMDWSEKAGVKSHFFFMDYGYSDYDKFYRLNNRKIQKLIKNIRKRGHHLGFHPSYELYNDAKTFKKVKNEVAQQIGKGFEPIGRQHFLRFQVPTTWQVWEEAGMQWDSTLSYASVPGFRCGVCYPYTVFNVLSGKKLRLMEKPLIFMEQSCIHYLEMSPAQTEMKATQLINQVKKYHGEFVMLWHNSSINTYEFKPYKKVFEKIMKQFI